MVQKRPVTVLLFMTQRGRSPVVDWMLELQGSEFAECLALLRALQNYGSGLSRPVSAPVGDKLFELRDSVDRVQLRLLYYFLPEAKAVVVTGFVKGRPQDMKAQVDLAKRRRREFLAEPAEHGLAFDEVALAEEFAKRRKS